MEEQNETNYKTWDFLIGVTLVISSGFRFYNHTKTGDFELDYNLIFTIIYALFGMYLIVRHLRSRN